MKTETLEIQKDAAVKAHDNAKNSGKKLLEDLFGKKTFQKKITDRIKEFQDVLNELGHDDEDVMEYHKMCTVFTDTRHHLLNYQRAVLIAKALNEGWEPDFGNFDEWKYYPWFKFQKGSTAASGFGFSYDDWARSHAATLVGARLCFKSSELAEYAGKQFTAIYKSYLTFNK